MKDYALNYSAYTTLIYNLLSLYSPNHPNTSLHHSLTSHIYEVLRTLLYSANLFNFSLQDAFFR